jgi:hypothetical protein
MSPLGYTEERLNQMLRQRDEALRYLGVLIDRLGGEVRIGVEELGENRIVQKDTIGIAGVIVLRTEKP